MNILVVQDTDWLTRGPHQNHHLMERLAKKGNNIRVIDFELLWREQTPKEIISKRKVFKNVHKLADGGNITVIRPPIIKIPFLEYLSLVLTHRTEIKRQIREFKPDVILGWGILNSYVAMKLAKKNKIPFIYYIIDELFRLVPQKYFWSLAKTIERQNMKEATSILSINEYLREYTIRMGASRKNTSVIRAGVDLDRYNPNLSGNSIRQRYGIGKEDVVLFFMGWLYHFAGLKKVAKELAKISEKNQSIKLLIVGEGDAYEDLQKIKRDNQLDSQMILTGKQPYEKIPELISAADICLLPADPNEEIMQNIVPIKMYEYMAMKKPVLTTRLPGLMKEFGKNNGVIYVNQSEKVLYKAIDLIESEKIEKHGEKARKFVEKNSWDDIVAKFERIMGKYV